MKIMAVDFGDARTGLAMCDKTEFLASPIGVIHEKRFEHAVEKVAAAAVEHKAEAVIVGLPLNMNGSEGPRAELCREFASKLPDYGVTAPIRMWDERQTTVTSQSSGRFSEISRKIFLIGPQPMLPLMMSRCLRCGFTPAFSFAAALSMWRKNIGRTGIPLGIRLSAGMPSAAKSSFTFWYGVTKMSVRTSSAGGLAV